MIDRAVYIRQTPDILLSEHAIELLTDPRAQHLGRRQLRLVCAANDLDGFVEIDLRPSSDSR